MRLLIILCLSCAMHLITHAETQYFYIKPESQPNCPKTGITVKTWQESGHIKYKANPDEVIKSMNHVKQHADSYPPIFKNQEERQCIEAELKLLIKVLKVESEENNLAATKILYAYCLAMGHHLDLKGYGELADKIYKEILAKEPDNCAANYAYGKFLLESDRISKAILYSLKALPTCPEANRTLFLAYGAQQDKQKEIKHLEEYLKHYPNQELENFLNALKDGRVTTKIIKK